MHPTILTMGPVTVHSYGLMIAIGFGFGLVLIYFLGKREGLPAGRLMDLAFWTALGGIIGARLIYVLIRWNEYIAPLFSEGNFLVFRIWQGGLTFYGGLLGGLLVGLILIRHWRLPVMQVLDIAAPALAVGQAFGRLGCLLAGCCWGKPVDLPWAMAFPKVSIVFNSMKLLYIQAAQLEHFVASFAASVKYDWVSGYGSLIDRLTNLYYQIGGSGAYLDPYFDVLKRADASGNLTQLIAKLGEVKAQALSYFKGLPTDPAVYQTVPLHPAQLMNSLALFLIFGILMVVRRFRGRYGEVFFTYTLLHATLRLLMEPIRGDIVPKIVGFGILSETQMVAIGLIVVSIGMLIFLSWRGRHAGSLGGESAP
jgi:prolipoprotein diacylglyceryltransferase